MPSILNELLAAEVKTFTEGALSLILIDSSKLKAQDTIKFRADLRKAGASYRISKAALVQRAMPEGTAKIISFSGPVGVIKPSSDIAAAAKVVNALVKEEKLAIKGGLLDGKTLDSKAAAKLADLPTREQAHVMLIRTLSANFVQLVRIVKVKSEEGADAAVSSGDAAPAATA